MLTDSDGVGIVGAEPNAYCFVREWSKILNEDQVTPTPVLPSNMKFQAVITDAENQLLTAIPSMVDVEGVVKSFKKWKAPGSDGFPAESF